MYLQFKSRNHYNIREQFCSILLQPSLRVHWEIALDNRSSVHEFHWIFNALFTVAFILPHIHMFCGGNALEISIHLIFFSLHRRMSFKSELLNDYKDRFHHKLQLSLRQLQYGDISIYICLILRDSYLLWALLCATFAVGASSGLQETSCKRIMIFISMKELAWKLNRKICDTLHRTVI